jgi:hypothetical protein
MQGNSRHTLASPVGYGQFLLVPSVAGVSMFGRVSSTGCLPMCSGGARSLVEFERLVYASTHAFNEAVHGVVLLQENHVQVIGASCVNL